MNVRATRWVCAYLALVPGVGLLLVLLGQLVVLGPDLVDALGQVRVRGVHLHKDAGVLDLLMQGLHLLGAAAEQHATQHSVRVIVLPVPGIISHTAYVHIVINHISYKSGL